MKGQGMNDLRALLLVVGTSALSLSATSAPLPGDHAPLPGAVNYVEGQVSLDGQSLSSRSIGSATLGPNDVLDTGQGFAEVLLTPGAFLRVGPNSEVRLNTAGVADTRLQLVRGSALIEDAQFVKGTHLAVSMNGVTGDIEKEGLYSFDAGRGAIRVLDGRAKVTEMAGQVTLRKGDQVMLAGAPSLKRVSFSEKAAQEDPLYIWSKVRSQDESAANVNAANRMAYYGGFNGAGWYWDPYWSSYAFLPAYGFLGSPFGFGFYSPASVFGAPYGGFYGRGFRGGVVTTHSAAAFSGVGGFHGGGGRR